MSSFSLRLLALLCMFVDHAGLALFPNIGAFRCVGRLALPLYCFLLTQGFLHTRNQRSYRNRLMLFALLAEIPFDLLTFGQISSTLEQNALFSLQLGLFALYGARTFEKQPVHAALCSLLLMMLAMLARVSFGWLPVALCLCFYYFRNHRLRMVLSAGVILIIYTLSLQLSGVALSWVLVSLCSLLALPLLLLYNNKRGLRTPVLTLLFYAAYPLHMLAFVFVRMLRIIPPNFLH